MFFCLIAAFQYGFKRFAKALILQRANWKNVWIQLVLQQLDSTVFQLQLGLLTSIQSFHDWPYTFGQQYNFGPR